MLIVQTEIWRTKKQTKVNRLQNGLTDSMDLPINDHTAEEMLRDSMKHIDVASKLF